MRAKTQTEIAHISYRKLRSLTDLYPSIVESMTEQLAHRLTRTNQKLGDLAFMDVYGRVAHTLLEMSKQPDAITHPAGIQIRVTRQELARVVGCSRETDGKAMECRHLAKSPAAAQVVASDRGSMPPLGGALTPLQIRDVTGYVVSRLGR